MMRHYCEEVEVVVAKRRSLPEHIVGVIPCLFSGRPLATHSFFYEELAAKTHEIFTNHRIDLIQIEHSFFAPYIDGVPSPILCKKILSLHNLGVSQYRSMLNLKMGMREKLLFFVKWLLMLRWEARYAKKFDRVLVVSPSERQWLQAANPRLTISVIENGIDTHHYQPLAVSSEPPTLIFVGIMGYPPNVDAVLWFCREMLPHIQVRLPDIKLLIVGHHPAPEIQKLGEHNNISVTGHVLDLTPYYQRAHVSIVPLRAGGGTRLKILEAMALGRPVVSTSLGCEGLKVKDGKNILLADHSMKFAEQLIKLLQNSTLQKTIAHHARQLVETQYDWRIIGTKLLNVYEQLLR
jgi:glycosyltransferase involved in cell wall biosynthesis